LNRGKLRGMWSVWDVKRRGETYGSRLGRRPMLYPELALYLMYHLNVPMPKPSNDPTVTSCQ
jgi:hypothetical protein